jgi:D-3-phosphoglycerate dehydrogenase / 2-oxoglutarate reductase
LDKKLGFEYTSTLEDLLSRSDIVSLHVPATAETKNLVSKEFLSHMKADSVLINTTRGSVVSESDLLERLESTPTFWFGTDVFANEPAAKGAFENAVAKHPRVYGSHHIGASTKQAESAIGDEAVRIIKKFASSGAVDSENCVNRERDLSKLHKISIRHLD